MTAEEGFLRRHKWWKRKSLDQSPVPCSFGDEGAFPVRYVDFGPPLGIQAMDDRYDENGLWREAN